MEYRREGTSVTESNDQIKVEQERISAMYERLDREVNAARMRLAELGAPAQGGLAPAAGTLGATAALGATAVTGSAGATAGQAAVAATLARRLGDLCAAEPALCFGRIDHADGTTLHIGRC